MLLAITGSIVVLPFWLAALLGWSVGGLGEVWGDAIGPESAYALHGSQIALFYSGLALLAKDIFGSNTDSNPAN